MFSVVSVLGASEATISSSALACCGELVEVGMHLVGGAGCGVVAHLLDLQPSRRVEEGVGLGVGEGASAAQELADAHPLRLPSQRLGLLGAVGRDHVDACDDPRLGQLLGGLEVARGRWRRRRSVLAGAKCEANA